MDTTNNNNNTNNSSKSSEEERENGDGAVDELHAAANRTGKRPRGRPPGSKNKPKTPTYLSVDPQDALRSHVMEVASGADIWASLAAYARSRGRGVSVLHAIGSVLDVTVRHQNHDVNSSSTHHNICFRGKTDIISLSGTVLPENSSLGPTGLTVFVMGPRGQVIGGPVQGSLVADGTVMVMAATFSTATYEKLPLQVEAGSSGLGGSGPNLTHQDPGPNQPAMEDPRSGAGYHPGLHMNMGMENGSAAPGGGPPESASYAWFLQQQQHHHNSNGRQLYMNN